ncbi:MAG: tetratricopeptide repeat protein [Verrucomicrobiota bacterium]|jgi:Flp pilus assembly protein TadD
MNDIQGRGRTWLICLGLALAVLAAYAPVFSAGFITYDDPIFVTANPHVRGGLSWAGFIWAFTTCDASIWHPLTWLSYLVDSELYGMNPGGFHVTNALLHLANSILLFLLLQRMTKATWPSALAAALFALHPLHVESVAWVSERKDVLSTLFWMLAVGAYVRYVEQSALKSPESKTFYFGSLVLFALGLMAKPMLVTLPLILLLLDYWPLQRRQASVAALLAEKAPFFILAAASCALTLFVARHADATVPLAGRSLASHLENVPLSYVRYIAKTFWPVDLAVFYPYERHWPVWDIAGAVAFLGLMTGWVLWQARSRPYCAVGWFWFLIMLAPVIGVVQVGSFSIADRWSYLSNTGLFIMVIWAGRVRPQALGFAGSLALAACLTATAMQVRYWKDSETLYRHALAVTGHNGAMENTLGNVLLQQGRVDEALPHLLRAVAFAPDYPQSHYNLGSALLASGKVAEALSQFETQVALQPNDPFAQYNFGRVLVEHGLADDAIPHLEKAVQLRPDLVDYHCELGDACRQSGRAAEAVSEYNKTLQFSPRHVQAVSRLAWMLATSPDPSLRNGAKAVQLARLADQLSGGQDPKILGVLAAAYAETGDFSTAAASVRRALQLSGAETNSALAGVLRAQLASYRTSSPFRDTIKGN